MGYMIAGLALAMLGLVMFLTVIYNACLEAREDVKVLLEQQNGARERLERMEKLLSDRGGPAGAAIPAEREAEMSREMEEGVMNLLRYAAGKVPGVEVSM